MEKDGEGWRRMEMDGEGWRRMEKDGEREDMKKAEKIKKKRIGWK